MHTGESGPIELTSAKRYIWFKVDRPTAMPNQAEMHLVSAALMLASAKQELANKSEAAPLLEGVMAHVYWQPPENNPALAGGIISGLSSEKTALLLS